MIFLYVADMINDVARMLEYAYNRNIYAIHFIRMLINHEYILSSDSLSQFFFALIAPSQSRMSW